MQRIALCALITLLASTHLALATEVYPRVAKGTMNVNGREVSYTTEYYGDSSYSRGAEIFGPNRDVPWLDIGQRGRKATTFEGIADLYTADSQEQMQAQREAMEQGLPQRNAIIAQQPPGGYGVTQYFIVVKILEDGVQHQYVALDHVLGAPKAGKYFVVSAQTLCPDGLWRLNLPRRTDPIAKILASGLWTKLGAPEDFPSASYVAATQRAARQPTTRPATRPSRDSGAEVPAASKSDSREAPGVDQRVEVRTELFPPPRVIPPARTSQQPDLPAPVEGPLPRRTEGVLEKDGKQIAFVAEYWGWDERAAQQAPNDMLEVLKRADRATTWDDLTPCYTRASIPVLEKNRREIEDFLQNHRDSIERGHDPAGEPRTIGLIVREKGNEAVAYLVHGPRGRIGRARAAMMLEDEQWKFRLPMEHPILDELRAGRWKQFGAPEDREDNRLKID